MTQTPTFQLSTKWTQEKLGEHLRLINGRAYKREELLDQGCPVLRIQNLNGGDRWYYSDLDLPDDKYCEKGDLLYAWSASFGPYIWSGPKAIYHYHIWKIIPKKTIDKKYAFYMLDWITESVKSAAHGVTMMHVTKASMEDWNIPLPPLAEQQRIAAILDQADTLRVKRRAALARLDRLVQAVFLEMFGDPVTNPMGWEVRPLGSVSQVKGGLQLSSKRNQGSVEVPYLRVANVHRGKLDLSEIKYMKVTESELERTRLIQGDILIVEGHGNADEIGRSAVWDGSITLCVHQNHLIRAQVDRKILQPVFVNMYLNSQGGRRQLIKSGKTTSGLNTISTSQVRDTSILVPPLELQDNFVHRINKLHQLITKYQSSSVQLDRLFSSLQQRAFRGEL